jgi:hypothetical protein
MKKLLIFNFCILLIYPNLNASEPKRARSNEEYYEILNNFIDAVKAGDLDLAKKIFKENKIDINGHDQKGRTALVTAVMQKNRPMIEWLIANNADPRVKAFGEDARWWANTELIPDFLPRDFNNDISNLLYRGTLEDFRNFIEEHGNQVNWNVPIYEGDDAKAPPLAFAISKGKYDHANELLNNKITREKIDISAHAKDKYPALYWAAYNIEYELYPSANKQKYIDFFILLLNLGAKLDFLTHRGDRFVTGITRFPKAYEIYKDWQKKKEAEKKGV